MSDDPPPGVAEMSEWLDAVSTLPKIHRSYIITVSDSSAPDESDANE